jgi:hypothetical protein
MKIGLAIENDVTIMHLMPMVRGIDQALKACVTNTRCSSFLSHSELAMVILSRDCPAKKRRGRLLAA